MKKLILYFTIGVILIMNSCKTNDNQKKDSEISENFKDGSSIKLEDTISEEKLDCFDGFEIAKINLDKIITKKIRNRAKY